MIGIYCITNPNGKIYIGSSVNIQRRFADYKRLHCKNQTHLYNSLVKYGIDNHQFDIHLECAKEDLFYFEQLYIDRLKPELNISKIVGCGPCYSGEDHHNWKGGLWSNPKEYMKEYLQEYRATNKEKQREYMRQYRARKKLAKE